MTRLTDDDQPEAHEQMLLETLHGIARIGTDDHDIHGREDVAQRVEEILSAATGLALWAWCASITHRRAQRAPVTLGFSSPAADSMDAEQYTVGVGPCLDALDSPPGDVISTRDMCADPRWPQLGGVTSGRALVVSVVSCSIFGLPGERASLNLYVDPNAEPLVSTAQQHREARMAAAVAGVALSTVLLRSKSDNLGAALESNRKIGAALGVLIAVNQWTYDQAYLELRNHSQQSNRKLRDVADEVLLTGTLPALPIVRQRTKGPFLSSPVAAAG